MYLLPPFLLKLFCQRHRVFNFLKPLQLLDMFPTGSPPHTGTFFSFPPTQAPPVRRKLNKQNNNDAPAEKVKRFLLQRLEFHQLSVKRNLAHQTQEGNELEIEQNFLKYINASKLDKYVDGLEFLRIIDSSDIKDSFKEALQNCVHARFPDPANIPPPGSELVPSSVPEAPGSVPVPGSAQESSAPRSVSVTLPGTEPASQALPGTEAQAGQIHSYFHMYPTQEEWAILLDPAVDLMVKIQILVTRCILIGLFKPREPTMAAIVGLAYCAQNTALVVGSAKHQALKSFKNLLHSQRPAGYQACQKLGITLRTARLRQLYLVHCRRLWCTILLSSYHAG